MEPSDLGLRTLGSPSVVGAYISDLSDARGYCRPHVREACEENTCGYYGRNHMCPPMLPPLEVCDGTLRRYDTMLLVKTAYPLENEFDVDGMMSGMKAHQALVRDLREEFRSKLSTDCFALSAGACMICDSCSCGDGGACRFPDMSIPSIEGYCIDLVELTGGLGIRYAADEGTVTYFGMILFRRDSLSL
ncbi:MAG: DUF2284 domain-containing protein [Candidatus Methanomethylophilaceae archaeon]